MSLHSHARCADDLRLLLLLVVVVVVVLLWQTLTTLRDCGHDTESTQQFTCLPLSAKTGVSVQNLLDQYCQRELIVDEGSSEQPAMLQCDYCKKEGVVGHRTCEFENLPRVLVLVVTRARLHEHTVVLDERVHVGGFDNTLFSALVRREQHYYAYVKEPTAGGGWHKFDDMAGNSYAEAIDDWDDVRRTLGSSDAEQAMTLFYKRTVKREREASAPTRVAQQRRSEEAGHVTAGSPFGDDLGVCGLHHGVHSNVPNAGATSSWRSLSCPDPDEDEDANAGALIERSLADEDEDEAGVSLITQGLRVLHHGEAESANAVGGDGWVEVLTPSSSSADAKDRQ